MQQRLNAGQSERRLPPSVLATCVIPWDRKFRFQEDAFRNHVRLVSEHMTKHLYIFGTAGEGYAVTDTMFREIAAVFYDQAQRSNVTPMLGVISHSLGTVIERVEFGLIMGYRQFQISFPSWGTVSDTERDLFFREICGRFPQGKFLHYNVSRSGRVLTGAEYGRLAGRHRNLVAIKFTSSKRAVVHELVKGRKPYAMFPDRTGLRAGTRDCRLWPPGLIVRRTARVAAPLHGGAKGRAIVSWATSDENRRSARRMRRGDLPRSAYGRRVREAHCPSTRCSTTAAIASSLRGGQ